MSTSNSYTYEDLSSARDAASAPRLIRPACERDEWLGYAEAVHASRVNGLPRGPVTGFPKLDRELGGVLMPGLHIVHGQPGTGKTALAWQIAASSWCPALFITCEMSPSEMLRRLVARVTGTYLGRIKSGELPPEVSLDLFDQACRTVPHLALIDATQAFASPAWLREVALAVRGDLKHLLIVVDSIHAWAEGGQGESTEYDTLNAGLSQLRALTLSLECPLLGIAERNRVSMKSGGLSAGAGTRKFEYGAESVWDLTKDPKDRPDIEDEVPITLSLEKNRNGAAGPELAFKFHGALQRFREV